MINNDTLPNQPNIHQKQHADRVCILNIDDGPVSFVLHATNALQAEATVHLIPADDTTTTLESLRLATVDTTEGTLQTDCQAINNRRALIRFTAWSEHNDRYSGKIGIDIRQNGACCMISKPAEWLRMVPKFGTGQAFEWITIIHFYCKPAASA